MKKFKKNDEILSSIDRKIENEDVIKYQENGDTDALVRVYKNRIPTLKYWANKNYYPGLADSVNDFYSCLIPVFLKAVKSYDKKRGSFNTCLYTFLDNKIKNMKNSTHAKKRRSEINNKTFNEITLSMDYNYPDLEEDISLKDILQDKKSNFENIFLEDTISILSGGNKIFKVFLEKLSYGETVSSLLKEYKIKNGIILLKNLKTEEIKNNKNTLISLIKKRKKIKGDFNLVDYKITGKTVKYTIEMKKTKETDFILKFIRNLKSNEDLKIFVKS